MLYRNPSMKSDFPLNAVSICLQFSALVNQYVGYFILSHMGLLLFQISNEASFLRHGESFGQRQN